MTAPIIFVAYFSRSGTTRKVAIDLAAALNSDIEEITEPGGRKGLFGYIRSVIEARQQPSFCNRRLEA